MKKFTIILTLAAAKAFAATPEQTEFFESKIRPVLAQNCYECHSAAGKKKGGLLLDSRPGWQAGGESGASIVPGDAKKSLLIASIRHQHDDLKMPKAGAKLEPKVIADFEKWINDGANDPRDKPPTKEELAKATDWKTVLEARKDWWCLKPLLIPDSGFLIPDGTNPVDVFIDAKLKEQGLSPAPKADDTTITRRLHYVLTGLPPNPSELAEGIKNQESKIKNLVASPRFGEAWARHFMDWVRYAETHGSEGDAAIPYAWRYRDYLVRAFNSNVPYPELVRESIAGDLIPKPRIRDGINESAIGAAQLRMVLHGFSPVDSLDEMVTFTENQIDTVSKAFQAMTVTCARCHNHKFDAISQTDFYSMYGIFTSTHPAVVDVNATDDKAMRAEMREIKGKLRSAVGKAWLAAVQGGDRSDTTKASDKAEPQKWYASGKGVSAEPSPAGEFAVATEGTAIIARIHPRGWFSDLISTKDSAVIASPRFKNEGGTLWMRSAGEGGSRARYIVQNYPRTGTIHKATEFKAEGDATLGWHQLDLDYWKGDEIFVQCANAADLPAETKLDERSWFGITEWRITPKDAPAPENPKPSGDARAAVTAWLNGSATDVQAELLDSMLRAKKLPNDRREIAEAEPLLAKYRALETRLPAPVRVPGVMEADATDRALFVQGNHKQPSEIVPRRFLEALDPTPYQSKDSGRLQLANSMADMKRNPLTARVIVNRLWHHVFGRGIVATTDNFGRLGEVPSHPELLDYLAQKFIDSGGDIKAMISLMVSSQTFMRSDRAPANCADKDPDNKLLSHWTVRRLEAESIRDSMLQLSGNLDLTMGGEPVSGKDMRRSVYVKVARNSLDPFLTVFDAPVPSNTRGKRDATNVPAQSLTMLNDSRVQNASKQWAKRMTGDDATRVKQMFVEAFARQPTSKESDGCIAFVKTSSHAGDDQRKDLDSFEAKVTSLRSEIESVLGPVRDRLAKKLGIAPIKEAVPEPYAEWDFEDGGQDLKSHLPLTLNGKARTDHGSLILDGKSYARSVPLPKTLTAKTLEAWVMLDNLDQRGGGVITVEDSRGGVFDSIVFGEKAAHSWVPGSDNFKRSQLLDGALEQEADKRPVHIAMVYEANGQVTAYRDGVKYGDTYKSVGPAEFKAGDAHVQFGCRHGTGGGNKFLIGRILRARLYDHALTAQELNISRVLEQSTVSERDVLEALAPATREAIKAKQASSPRSRTKPTPCANK